MKEAPTRAEGAPVQRASSSLDSEKSSQEIASARTVVKSNGGDWCGCYGLVPGPGHSPKDRSLKVWEHDGRIYVHSFAGDDWRECRRHLGLDGDWRPGTSRRLEVSNVATSRPSARVRDLLRTSASPDLVEDAVAYLQSRKLWPLPPGCVLRAHVGAEYWEAGDPPALLGRYPAIVAPVVDIAGDLVTLHVTYLKDGRKVEGLTPRKLLSGTTGRTGCAVRLMPLDGPVLAVAEGVESALAAGRLLGLPTWSCLSSGLLGRFTPPPEVERLVVAVDRDDAGIRAAVKLANESEVPVEVRLPTGSDFAADLEAGR